MQSDVAVIGGGFFGCEIALELHRLGFRRIVLFEREAQIMGRASAVNQARIHHGYHYPRSLSTAASSRENFARFVEDYAYAVDSNFEHLYAIARHSQVNATQFERLCATIKAPLELAPARLSCLFDSSLIEETFCMTIIHSTRAK